MSISVSIDPRSLAAMQRMQDALAIYGAETSRAPAKFLADATSKLLLGETVDGGGRNDGLFDLMRATAPAQGFAAREAEARKYRMGRRDSTSLSIARARVNEMLGRGESGVFKTTGDKSRSALTLGTLYQRGKRKGQINFRARRDRLASPNDAVGVTRAAAKASGGSLLNRQSAIVAIALRRREAARTSVAAQFLPSRYRRTLTQLKGIAYRGGNAVGMRGGSADQSRYHLHKTALVQNAKGRTLGALEVMVSGREARATIIGRLGLYTSAQQTALAGAMNMVADYAVRRVLQNAKASAANIARARALSR